MPVSFTPIARYISYSVTERATTPPLGEYFTALSTTFPRASFVHLKSKEASAFPIYSFRKCTPFFSAFMAASSSTSESSGAIFCRSGRTVTILLSSRDIFVRDWMRNSSFSVWRMSSFVMTSASSCRNMFFSLWISSSSREAYSRILVMGVFV